MDDNHDDELDAKILPFPKGDKVTPSDLGADYVVDLTKGTHHATEIIDPDDISKELRGRDSFVSKQELYQSALAKESTIKLVDSVVLEITEELAHLKYERIKAAREGKNTSGYTINRISSLRQLAEVLMKRMDNARAEQIDLKSPRFKSILRLWMEFVYESMQKAELADHQIDLVFKQMEADMVELEKKILDTVV
jgi:hypothetical protein